MWETRGDNWKTKADEPSIFDELYPSSITYDLEGNVIEIGDEEVGNLNILGWDESQHSRELSRESWVMTQPT